MKLTILERYGWIEVASRIVLQRFPEMRKTIKKLRAEKVQGDKKKENISVNPAIQDSFFRIMNNSLDSDDIVLIHSSLDGLEKIGITDDVFIEKLKELVVKKNITMVFPCFPVTNLKLPTEKSKPYDPKKTICWTGLLPILFIRQQETIRTLFPYNSLAAMGPKANEMMAHNLDALYVYDENFAWRFCLDHHAKIMFVGVKASGANTMAIHMIPDVMADEWPIEDWYNEVTYKLKIDDKVVTKTIKVQKDKWYQYVMEERTSGRLKEAGILTEQSFGGCNFGIVEDSAKMVEEIIRLCKKGKLMYMIPRRYYKK